MSDPLIGIKLGSYEVIEAIGEGGMARIYKGFHPELKRYVAIKVVLWGLQEDPEVTERFRREAQAIAALRHPNIVQIFDFGKHESGYYMIMEYIDGQDLAATLRQIHGTKSLLPQEQIVRIVTEVAAALDHAHEKGVIHRDVKPSNTMINEKGQSILTDFGLVMLSSQTSRPTMGGAFGTPHYIAPEQAISSAAAVKASDIYSLGIMLYEMVTGQLPFDDESPLSVALKHVSELPTPPTAINPDLPRSVEDVILKALSKEPSERFETASEMAQSLEMAWNDTSPESEERANLEPLLPVGVPPAAQVSDITLPNVAAVAPPLPHEDRDESEVSTEEEAERRVERGRRWPMWWPLALVGGALGGIIGALLLFFLLSRNSDLRDPSLTPNGDQGAAFVLPTEEETVIASLSPTLIEATEEVSPQVRETTRPTGQATPTSPPSPTSTSTSTPTSTPTSTHTPLPTETASPTPTFSPTPTPTPTSTLTPSPVPTLRSLPTATPAPLPTPTLFTVDQLKNKILFKTDRSGSVEIYRMDADGRNQAPLPRENWSLYTELEGQMPFSNDGQKRIVIRGEGQLDLWLANLVTGQELRVTSTQEDEYDVAWSPVDNQLAYVSEETGRGDIYTLNLDGSAVTRLTINIDDFDKHPTWSPDGSRIAFWSDRGFNQTRQIWVIDLNTNIVTSLSDNPFNDWDPIWVH